MLLKAVGVFTGLLISSVCCSQEDGLLKVQQNICESYIRVLNNAPELKQRISDIGKHSGNPDMMIRELKEGVDLNAARKYMQPIIIYR